MIGWGCAVWGSGWYYPPYMYGGYRPIYYPYPHTYGMGAWYNPHTGAYGRGYRAYGPYGGVGMGASYNPRTGTYARGAAAYGPGGSRAAAPGVQPAHRNLRANATGLERVRELGLQLRPARRQLGADSASHELPDRARRRRGYGRAGRRRRQSIKAGWQDRRRLAGPPVAMSTRATMGTCTGGTKAVDGNKATGPAAGLLPKGTVAKGTVPRRAPQPALATVSRATVPRARLLKRISSNATAARVRKAIPEPRRAAAGNRAVRRDQERAAIEAAAGEPGGGRRR